ncbi:MAG: dCTP deaminase [Elusimicrobia bacterium RIFCSPLOWO2_12_FULL_59_9]|nr:MAG: dCTP deaminase [Elusimicrobia bacterium RIFCSPLOWO2_12_FULL_59_9]
MILSNRAIHKALDQGSLVIDPEPIPRRPDISREPCPYQTSAVDLRLSDEIVHFRSGKSAAPFIIDLSIRKFTQLPQDTFITKRLVGSDVYEIKPREFLLAQTLERVALPLKKGRACLAARVEGRSSYARSGLSVHFTAPTIHAGFDGKITLELMNHGEYSIMLRPGMFICQLIVEQVFGYPFENVSQFQNQSNPTGPRQPDR